MAKGKIIPLIVAALLIIIAMLLAVRYVKNEVVFEKLIVNNKLDTTTYDRPEADDIIVINDVSFWVISINKTQMVLRSNKYINDQNEFLITMNEATSICFTDDNCVSLILE